MADARAAGNRTVSNRARAQRRIWQEEGRSRARDADPLHIAGCMLYWAEGSKLRNSLEIANSDFNLLAFFMSFLRQEFPHYENAIAPRLNVYTGNGLAIEEVEEEWLTRLSLPRKSLRKHTINNRPAGRGGVKKNKLPYGVATLSLNRTHAVQHVWGAIQAYGDFDDPKYLDI